MPKRKKRMEGKQPVIFDGGGASWIESEETKGAWLRSWCWATQEEREAHHERIHRLGEFVAERLEDEAEGGTVVMDLTNPARGKAPLHDGSAEFLRRHLGELGEGAGEEASLRTLAAHLREHWGIQVGLKTLSLIRRNS